MSTQAKGNRMSRRLERPADPVFVRLELDPKAMPAVEDAAHSCRLSLASFARLAIEMLADGKRVSVEEVRKEADRRLAAAQREGKK